MALINELSEEVEEIVNSISKRKRSLCSLPGKGYLFLEHAVPFLIVFNRGYDDKSMLKLAKSKASYLIVSDEYQEFYQKLCCQITDAMSAKFGSYLIIEIYPRSFGDKNFIITGNEKKFPVTIEMLKNELAKIDRKKEDVKMAVEVKNTNNPHDLSHDSLLDIDGLISCGAQFLQLGIPPVYKFTEKEVFPIYFRRFRKAFNKALQKAMYEYTRVQTSSNIHSYTALGKRKIDDVVFNIDKQLYDIQVDYQFLLLIAPTNVQQIRKHFFDTDFKEVLDFHYRLLPIDPDLLKRKLFNLRLEDIDDPALAYLFDEKREEIDQELTMLKERGKPGFQYRSVRLYRGIEKSLIDEAELILAKVPENTSNSFRKSVDAQQFSAMVEDEFAYFRQQVPEFAGKIHVRDDVNIIMVSNGELYLPSDFTSTEEEANALIQHEIGTHVLTYFNGKQQPLYQMAIGLADYDPLQEGMAVLSEYLIGGLTGNRLRIIAGRVVAGAALMQGLNFKQMFHLLYDKHGFTKGRAFNITSRMLQGGGFLKDIIYLKGLVQLTNYIKKGGDLRDLLAGKFAIQHVNVIRELTDRHILKGPTLLPRYMSLPDYQNKINQIKEGLPIYKFPQL